MTILEMVANTMSEKELGAIYTREEIIDFVVHKYDVNRSSVNPSDYCYNMTNKDKESNHSLKNFNILVQVGRGLYQYVGPNYVPANTRAYIKSNTCGKRIISNNQGYNTRKASSLLSNQYNNFQLNELWWNGTEEQWDYAEEHYWTKVKSENMALEKKLDQINMDMITSYTAEEFYNFLHNEYFPWKYTAKNRLATTRAQLQRYKSENKMDELEAIHKKLITFNHNDIVRGLEIAKQIHGLGASGASGLLAILFPQHFGTVDQFVTNVFVKRKLGHKFIEN